MKSYEILGSLPSSGEEAIPLIVPESAVLFALKSLNPRKASGHYGVPNRLIKEYAEFYLLL